MTVDIGQPRPGVHSEGPGRQRRQPVRLPGQRTRGARLLPVHLHRRLPGRALRDPRRPVGVRGYDARCSRCAATPARAGAVGRAAGLHVPDALGLLAARRGRQGVRRVQRAARLREPRDVRHRPRRCRRGEVRIGQPRDAACTRGLRAGTGEGDMKFSDMMGPDDESTEQRPRATPEHGAPSLPPIHGGAHRRSPTPGPPRRRPARARRGRSPTSRRRSEPPATAGPARGPSVPPGSRRCPVPPRPVVEESTAGSSTRSRVHATNVDEIPHAARHRRRGADRRGAVDEPSDHPRAAITGGHVPPARGNQAEGRPAVDDDGIGDSSSLRPSRLCLRHDRRPGRRTGGTRAWTSLDGSRGRPGCLTWAELAHRSAFDELTASPGQLDATRGSRASARSTTTCCRAGPAQPLVPVADAAHGDDPRRGAGSVLDLRAQPLDVHVEGLGVADVVAAPDPVDQRRRG